MYLPSARGTRGRRRGLTVSTPVDETADGPRWRPQTSLLIGVRHIGICVPFRHTSLKWHFGREACSSPRCEWRQASPQSQSCNVHNLIDLYAVKLPDDKSQRVTYADRCRLGHLLSTQECSRWGSRCCRAQLEVVLEQAEPVEAHAAPDNLVTMNSTVRLADLLTKERRTVTLVYPDDVDLASDGVSILEPLGTALLGCEVGDVIQCPAEKCQRRFRIAEVVYQPEHAGAFHL